jgi:hypothetical protein
MGSGIGSGIEPVEGEAGGTVITPGAGARAGEGPPDTPIVGRLGGAETSPMKVGGAPDAVSRCTG